jgi:hypothetical protein
MARQGKTAAERAHMDRVAQMPCLACGNGPVELHHVVGYADRIGRAPKRHDRVVPLCAFCHRHGKLSVHGGSHRSFFANWGVDLMAEAERLWSESDGGG